jgi:hypothetical protein
MKNEKRINVLGLRVKRTRERKTFRREEKTRKREVLHSEERGSFERVKPDFKIISNH